MAHTAEIDSARCDLAEFPPRSTGTCPRISRTLRGQDDSSKTISESLIRQSALLAACEPMEVDGKVFHKPRLNVHPDRRVGCQAGDPADRRRDRGRDRVHPEKIGNSTFISTESIDDASVDVLNKLGTAMARGLSHAIDSTALSPPLRLTTTPAGLLPRLTANAPEAGADAAFGLDDVLNGISAVETVGGNADVAFINGADLGALRKIKTTGGGYIWLRGNSVIGDPAREAGGHFQGVAFRISPGIAAGTT